MKEKIHDIIIIGAGAAGLFSAINIPKKYSKLILEKNKNPGVKVLLSGGERANVSNMEIDGERDYFGQNKKALKSIFTRYNQWDIMSWFAEKGVNIVEEDRGRLILKSGDSKELLSVLVKEAENNNSKIICEQDVKVVRKKEVHPVGTLNGVFEIKTESGEKYFAKNMIVSSGGKSFFQVGTTGEGYNFAKDFGLNIIEPHRALGGLSTQENLSEISGISCDLKVELFDSKNNKNIYSEIGPLLFTHFGLSGPIIFNTGNALGEFLNKISLSTEGFKTLKDSEKYIIQNIKIKITFPDLEKIPKRVIKFFDLNKLSTEGFSPLPTILKIQNFRSWKEAKATGGGIDINELDKFMQSKKIPNLFFIGEVCDIVGKTGGFNLQWAWSSGYCCGEFFN